MSKPKRSYEVLNDIAAEYRRRLSRYDDAIRLLRECTEWSGRAQMPGIDWWDVQIDEGTMEEALAFLAAEPKEGRGERVR